MNILALITTLEKKHAEHGNIEVKITYEGITRSFNAENIWLSKKGPLCIDGDAEGIDYKNELMADLKR